MADEKEAETPEKMFMAEVTLSMVLSAGSQGMNPSEEFLQKLIENALKGMTPEDLTRNGIQSIRGQTINLKPLVTERNLAAFLAEQQVALAEPNVGPVASPVAAPEASVLGPSTKDGKANGQAKKKKN